jgi:hypothetical protein
MKKTSKISNSTIQKKNFWTSLIQAKVSHSQKQILLSIETRKVLKEKKFLVFNFNINFEGFFICQYSLLRKQCFWTRTTKYPPFNDVCF